MDNSPTKQLDDLKTTQSIISMFGVINMYFIVSDIYNLQLTLSFFIALVCVYFLAKASMRYDRLIEKEKEKLES